MYRHVCLTQPVYIQHSQATASRGGDWPEKGMPAGCCCSARRRLTPPAHRLLLPLLLLLVLLPWCAPAFFASTASASSSAVAAAPAAAAGPAFMSPARLLVRGGYGLLSHAATARARAIRAPLLMMTAAAAASSAGAGMQGQCASTSKPPCARVVPVPILTDNYAYLLIDDKTGTAACVDPAEPEKLLAAAKKEGVSISTLLCTHKHWDHAGGNEQLAALIPDLHVVTTKHEDIPAGTVKLGDGDTYALGSVQVTALYTPCHTRGHVLFFVTPKDQAERERMAPLLFSGDTLFVGGCGRFFEGDGAQMVEALLGRVAKLPPETLVYCGHEYTKSNLAFAAHVEPENAALQAKIAWAEKTLASGGYTIPSTVGDELRYNPFMRVREPAVVAAVQKKGGAKATDPATVMSALREMKNSF